VDYIISERKVTSALSL